MKINQLLIPATSVLLMGCAKPPEDIVAATVPHGQFTRTGCDELAILADMKRNDLSKLEEEQRAIAQEDRDSMWAIHVPVGSLRGNDRKDEIALIKGEVRSIANAQRTKACESS